MTVAARRISSRAVDGETTSVFVASFETFVLGEGQRREEEV